MQLYDEHGEEIQLDLEAVESALQTVRALRESEEDLFSVIEGEDLTRYYQEYVELVESSSILDQTIVAESVVLNESKLGDKIKKAVNDREDNKEKRENINNVFSDFQDNYLDCKKRFKLALKRQDYDEAQKQVALMRKLVVDVRAEIKNMEPQDINIIASGVSKILIGLTTAIANPILLRNEENDAAKAVSIGLTSFSGALAVGAGIKTLLSPITNWRAEVKEARRAANNGESTDSKKFDMLKADLIKIINSYDKYLRQYEKQLNKVKNINKAVDKDMNIDSITQRINQIDRRLSDEKLDADKAEKLRKERKELEAKLK